MDVTPHEVTDDLEQDEPQDDENPILIVYKNVGLKILAESNRGSAIMWGILLADVARLVASAPAGDDREAAERLIEIRKTFLRELDDPSATMEVSKE